MDYTAVCGATGLIGSSLVTLLNEKDTPVVVVGRDSSRLEKQFPEASACLDWDSFKSFDAANMSTIVNLAGAGVMDRKWTPVYKKTMTDSRIESTQSCVQHVVSNPKIRLINASAVHAYGIYSNDHEAFVEGDLPIKGGENCFLYDLISAWENSLQPAIDAGASVAALRLGVVLDRSGGGLAEMVPIFRAFLGGKQGSGKQIMSWISSNDVVSAIDFLIDHPELRGPVNLTAPGACTNRKVMAEFAKALKRPSLIPMPGFLARLFLGEAANELVLSGQRVEPKLLQESGFLFQDREIGPCLERLFRPEVSSI